MARRCKGTTRAGKPCSITCSSALTNDSGRLAAGPLQRGGDFCLFHAKPFCVTPGELNDRDCLIVLLDLETTGVDITLDRTVELAAVHCPVDSRFFGGGFSTVVHVEPELLLERGAAAQAVHGISNEEICTGPEFPVAWGRFLAWLNELMCAAVAETTDSDDEDWETRLLHEPPLLILVGHNAFKFDFPLLLCECLRHKLPCDCFQEWRFVDTLHIAQALARHGCVKLQCLVRLCGDARDLRAHRALRAQNSYRVLAGAFAMWVLRSRTPLVRLCLRLDDCVALRHVLVAWSESLGTTLPMLLRCFAFLLDLPSSLAQLSVLSDA